MKSGTEPKAFRIFGVIKAHNTTPTKIFKWWTFENSFLSWGQMAKRKTASHWINDDLHRGTAMAHRFYILDTEVSSQPWAHKIVADGILHFIIGKRTVIIGVLIYFLVKEIFL